MDVGMLWFDGDSSRDVEARIKRAAEFYRNKYGRAPNLCFVHPRTMGNGKGMEVAGMRILTSTSVLKDHFWLGVQEPESEAQSAAAAA